MTVPQQLARGCPHSYSFAHGHSVPETAAALEGRSDSEIEVDLDEKKEEGPLKDTEEDSCFTAGSRDGGGVCRFRHGHLSPEFPSLLSMPLSETLSFVGFPKKLKEECQRTTIPQASWPFRGQ